MYERGKDSVIERKKKERVCMHVVGIRNRKDDEKNKTIEIV